jgi:hypothetical protein
MKSNASAVVDRDVLDFYSETSRLTSVGRFAPLVERLTSDVPSLVHIIQGISIHEYVAPAYGIAIPEDRKSETHIRDVAHMLERALEIDKRDITIVRPPEKRLVGICQHFSSLLVALLRAKGIPARARYGFGLYFNPPNAEEHTVTEYWNDAQARWVLVDAQFDEVWRNQLKIEHDVLDVPRDRFLVAGDAWAQCRSGKADASKFGIFVGDMRGLWFIAGELVRDMAAVNKMEMLPWDVWGGMPKPNEVLDPGRLAFFDKVAELTRNPAASFDELRKLYSIDERLRVPDTVFNFLLNRAERV